MAEEIRQTHDAMVRAVLSDLAEAASFLQRQVPEELRQALNWSTLRLLEGSFVDEDLRRSEADFLYEVEHVGGEASLWLYILLEHQSTPDRWMRFRLLKYCLPHLGCQSSRAARRQARFVPSCRWYFTRVSGVGRTPPSSPTCLPSRCGIGHGCRALPTS